MEHLLRLEVDSTWVGHNNFAWAAQPNFAPVAPATGLGSLRPGVAETDYCVLHTKPSVQKSPRARTGWGHSGTMGRLFLTSAGEYGCHGECPLFI